MWRTLLYIDPVLVPNQKPIINRQNYWNCWKDSLYRKNLFTQNFTTSYFLSKFLSFCLIYERLKERLPFTINRVFLLFATKNLPSSRNETVIIHSIYLLWRLWCWFLTPRALSSSNTKRLPLKTSSELNLKSNSIWHMEMNEVHVFRISASQHFT